MSEKKRIRHLMQLFLEDALTEDGVRELHQALEGSEELRREFYETAVLNGLLLQEANEESPEIHDSVMAALNGKTDKESLERAILADLKPRDQQVDARKDAEGASSVRGERHLKAATVTARLGRQKTRYLGELKTDKRGRSWGYLMKVGLPIAAGIAICAAAILFLMNRRDDFVPPQLCAEVIDVEGNAVLTRRNDTIPIEKGMLIKPGEFLQTVEASTVRLEYVDGTMISVYPGSSIRLEKGAENKRIHLLVGAIYADVAKQPENKPMVVNTPYAIATVVGTRFSLQVESSRTRLEVEEGEVELASKSEERILFVTAGYHAEAGPGADKDGIVPTEADEQIDYPELRVTAFSLIDAETDQVIPAFDPLPDGAVIDLKKTKSRHFNFLIHTEGSVGTVRSEWNGKVVKQLPGHSEYDESRPFSVFGERKQPYTRKHDFTAGRLHAGDHLLKATPYRGSGAKRGRGRSLTIRLRVLPPAE